MTSEYLRKPNAPQAGPRAGRADRWDRSLLLLLTAAAGLPALAMVVGRREGIPAFALYSEPKLTAWTLLLAALLPGLWWARGRKLLPLLSPVLLKTPTLLLAGSLVAYMTTSLLWGAVPANQFFELAQYALLVPFLVSLVVWGQIEPRVREALVTGLLISLAIATLVGGLQKLFPTPYLPPIDPQFGVSNPSFLGYKNPMALALLGQIFLLAERVVAPTSGPRKRLAWALVLVAELIYLASLQSRTAIVALVVGGAGLALLGARSSSGEKRGRLLWLVVVCGLLLALLLVLVPSSRDRIATLRPMLESPQRYFESDRGTYLVNTLGMVRDHPLGVGLGDWQTFYPVYRSHNRERSFDDVYQVRRAHSDHVQMLGELGWPGLALWLGLLGSAAWSALRAHRRSDDRRGLFAGVQVLALMAAMCTDYYADTPYGKFQLFLLLGVACLSSPVVVPAMAGAPRGAARAAALAFSALGLAGALFGVGVLAQSHRSAELRETYRRTIEQADPQVDPIELAARAAWLLERHAEPLAASPISTKTTYKDHLLLAHAEHLCGRPARAEVAARRSLSLHPYYPNAFRLLAKIVGPYSPQRAREYASTYRYLMHEATAGFDRPYPILVPGPTPLPLRQPIDQGKSHPSER